MECNGVRYVRTWQTWTLHRQGQIKQHDSPKPPSTNKDTHQAHRERIQVARIKERMTVNELASAVQCNVNTITAFERGDEILPDDVQKRILAVLRIR